MTTASRLALTANHDTAIVNVAHARHEQIVGLKTTLNQNVFALGEALAEMRDHELYRALGYPSFEDYLVSDEVKLNRATAYRFMRIYQAYHEVREQAQRLDWTKLDILARIIKDDTSPERILPLLEQAAGMTRPALRDHVRGEKQARIVVTTTVDVTPASDVVHELHDNNETTYPTADAPEWQPTPPIEANYTVSDEDIAADLAPPVPMRPALGLARDSGAAQAIVASGRDDYIAQDFNRLVAYLLGSTDIAPRVVRNFTTTDVARILTRDEVAGLRRAIPVLEFALGVYADFERQNLRVVR